MGNDFVSTDERRAGIYVSFGKQEMDEHDTVVQKFDGKNYYIGGYLNQKLEGDWNVGSIVGYGYGKHQSNRTVMFTSVNKNLDADFNSHSIYGGVKDHRIVGTIVNLVHNLDMKVIAEGVETRKQYEYLKQISTDVFQGYIFSRPLKMEDLHHFIDQFYKVPKSKRADVFASLHENEVK